MHPQDSEWGGSRHFKKLLAMGYKKLIFLGESSIYTVVTCARREWDAHILLSLLVT